jgi:predicted MPP superfamily phosphohydrolase
MAPEPREPTATDPPGSALRGDPGRFGRALGRSRRAGATAARTLRSRPAGGRLLRALALLAVVLAGAAVGTALTPSVTAAVGPLTLDVRVVPSVHPGVQLLLPPAGEVSFDTHRAPVAVEAGISEVDPEGARELISSPARLRALQAEAPDVLRTATLQAGGLAAAFALIGAVGLSLLVHRTDWRRTRQAAVTSAALIAVTAATAGATFNSDRLAQPHFQGLLSRAPYVASQTSGLVQRLESYRSGLADIVQSVTTLYGTSDELPVIPGRSPDDVVTVLHVSDMHLNPLGFDLTARLVRQFGVDVVVDTGDITTWGTEVESATLARIRDVRVPYVFVRGNHDSARTQQAVAANPNAVVLDGRAAEVGGLVFAGLGDPRFTPDGGITLPSPSATNTGPSRARTASTPGASTATPAPSTAAAAIVPGEDPELVEGRRLARVVRDWNAAHPARPVAVAAFHEPAGTPPLDGLVPLVLSGHMHSRSVKDYPDGTRLMIQGSTGGAGFDSLTRRRDEPVPLTATVLYFARTGPRAGLLLAYDDVTVGGFGLASVSLERTVVRPEARAELAPGEVRGAAACPSGTLPPPSPGARPSTPADGAGPGRDPRCSTTVPSSGSRSIRPAPSR